MLLCREMNVFSIEHLLLFKIHVCIHMHKFLCLTTAVPAARGLGKLWNYEGKVLEHSNGWVSGGAPHSCFTIVRRKSGQSPKKEKEIVLQPHLSLLAQTGWSELTHLWNLLVFAYCSRV